MQVFTVLKSYMYVYKLQTYSKVVRYSSILDSKN